MPQVTSPPLFPTAVVGNAAIGTVRYRDIEKQERYDAEHQAKLAAEQLAFAPDDTKTSGLQWWYLATNAVAYARHPSTGNGWTGGGRVQAAEVELEANTTNYVEFNVVTHAVTANTDAFTEGITAFDLWEIETGSTSIIRMTDRRSWLPTNGTVTEVGDGETQEYVYHQAERVTHEEEFVTAPV